MGKVCRACDSLSFWILDDVHPAPILPQFRAFSLSPSGWRPTGYDRMAPCQASLGAVRPPASPSAHGFRLSARQNLHDCIQRIQVTTVRTPPPYMHKVMQVLHIFCRCRPCKPCRCS